MKQAFRHLCWLLVVTQVGGASDLAGPRLLRQEAQARQRHGKRHAVVQGTGAIVPMHAEGLAEAEAHVANESETVLGDESDVALTARLGAGVPECQKLLEKIRYLLHFHAGQLIDQGLHHHSEGILVAVFSALTKLGAGNATEESLEVIQAALGNLTLKTALQAGKVWTATDQSAFFYQCFPGLTPFRELEEHNYYGDIEVDTYQEPTVSLDTGDPYVSLHEVRYCYRIGTNVTAKRAFVAARKHIQEQVPCLQFKAVKPHVSGDSCVVRPAIEVRDQNSGCWAGYQKDSDGHNSGTILLNLGRGCEIKGMIVHQLLKILGVRKELSRIDRDKYLNVQTDHLREPWMARYFAKRMAPPAEEAYAQDPFDYLSINMYPAGAFTNGTSSSLEPSRDAFLAQFLGQRLGLSQLDTEALADLYGCPAKAKPTSPTRVLSQLLLAGRGVRFDGSCRDHNNVAENLTSLLRQEVGTCAMLDSWSCAAKEGISELCPFSCLRCVPADDALVALRNRFFQKESPRYCDDAECRSTDPEGDACKMQNPTAEQIVCETVIQAYCDDAGCESLDPEGRDCRERNPGAHQIECAVVSGAADFHGLALKATKDCADAAVTGIRFKQGPKATCRDLVGYCGHGTLGPQVRGVCPATCSENGYPCLDEAAAMQNLTAEGAEGCRDKGKDERPLLKVRGTSQTCEEISRFCLEHANSTVVQKKCPFTCGACVPGTGYKPHDADEDAQMTLDILATANLTRDVLGSAQLTGDILADSTTTPSVESE